jgi:hypothetical protein
MKQNKKNRFTSLNFMAILVFGVVLLSAFMRHWGVTIWSFDVLLCYMVFELKDKKIEFYEIALKDYYNAFNSLAKLYEEEQNKKENK